MLAGGTDRPVIIGVGSPWRDSHYLVVTGDYYEEHSGPFNERPGAIDAYFAARGARFEFGETPRPRYDLSTLFG